MSSSYPGNVGELEWTVLRERIAYYWKNLAHVYCLLKKTASEDSFREIASNLTNQIGSDPEILSVNGNLENEHVQPHFNKLYESEPKELRDTAKFRALLVSMVYLAAANGFLGHKRFLSCLEATIEAYRYGGTAEFTGVLVPKGHAMIKSEGRQEAGASGGRKKHENVDVPRKVALYAYLQTNKGASVTKIMNDIRSIYPTDKYRDADNADENGAELRRPNERTIKKWRSEIKAGWKPE